MARRPLVDVFAWLDTSTSGLRAKCGTLKILKNKWHVDHLLTCSHGCARRQVVYMPNVRLRKFSRINGTLTNGPCVHVAGHVDKWSACQLLDFENFYKLMAHQPLVDVFT